ncbi:MAG: metal ABC transporter permease [Planctomycetes bacterium]|nr:metal ABC transporter permease [Planctomycetota bacterium]
MTAAELIRVLTLQDYNTRLVLCGTLLFGACGGVVGAFMLLRKKSLVGDVASHAALPGIGLAYLILEAIAPGSGKTPVWLLVGAAAGSAGGLVCAGLIQRIRLIKEDAALGIVLSVFFGMGIVLLSVIQSLPTGSSAGLSEFIFGKAAALTAADVLSIAIASMLILLICGLLFKELSLLCFDESYAAALGWPTRCLDLLLTSLVVAVTVIGMPSVGLLLVVAQLVIPPTSARFWTDRHGPLTIISGALGGLSSAIGILVSALVPRLAAGAVIVLAGAGIFIVSMLCGSRRGVIWRWMRHRQSRHHIGQLDLMRACFEILEGTVEHDGIFDPDHHHPAAHERDLTAIPVSYDQLRDARSWSDVRLREVLLAAQRDGSIRQDADGHYRLTVEGMRLARRATRNHRLWEMYLIHFAHTAPSRVDREADEIEHVLEPELVEQLESLLEQDRVRARVPVNPHG